MYDSYKLSSALSQVSVVGCGCLENRFQSDIKRFLLYRSYWLFDSVRWVFGSSPTRNGLIKNPMDCQYSIEMAETCNCWIYDYGSDLLSPSLNDSSPYPHNSSLIRRVAFRSSPANHAFGTHPSSHHLNECVKCTFPIPSHEDERKSESGLNDMVRFILSCRSFRHPGVTTEIVAALIKAIPDSLPPIKYNWLSYTRWPLSTRTRGCITQ